MYKLSRWLRTENIDLYFVFCEKKNNKNNLLLHTQGQMHCIKT